MEKAPPGSPAVDQQASLFGHFAKAEGMETGVSVPFDKNMAYAVAWVPTRKRLMIYGFDPRTPKPFKTAKLHIAGLQQKSYYQIRQELFQGYSFDIILLPQPHGTMVPTEEQVILDFFEMQRLASSYKPGLVPLYKIWRRFAETFAGERGW